MRYSDMKRREILEARAKRRQKASEGPAENKALSGPPENKVAPDLESKTVAELRAMADNRDLVVKGTGQDGRVLKADLIKALGYTVADVRSAAGD